MPINQIEGLRRKLRRKRVSQSIRVIQLIRSAAFRTLSDNRIQGRPKRLQPVQVMGRGRVTVGSTTSIGYFPSPAWTGVCHIEARRPSASVTVGDRCSINNGFTVIAEGSSITIGDRCLIGPNVSMYDSDFHALSASDRGSGMRGSSAPIVVGDDVFIGSDVTVLKGVRIGSGAVIGARSLVTHDIPPNSLAGGVPARILGSLQARDRQP